MKLNVTFRHFEPKQNEFNEIAKHAADKFLKFYDNILSVNIEFDDDVTKKIHISVHVEGNDFDATADSDDFKKSLPLAEDKIVSQIKRWKDKRSQH